MSHFLDPEWIKTHAHEKEKYIAEAVSGHILRVDMMKSLIRANKGMMEEFWGKHFTSSDTGEEIIPESLREQQVQAFMFIHKKSGKIHLDYMNEKDMKNTLYLLYDGISESRLEQKLGK